MNARMRMAVALLAVVLAACDSPAEPSGPFEGTWYGTLVDSAGGTGSVQLVLKQSGAGVSGTFKMEFTNVLPDSAGTGGTVSGTATATSASIFLKPSTPLSCGLSGTMGATVSTSTVKLTGNYSSLACNGAVTGTLDLGRVH
jgi:hypothetical protein